MAFDLLNILPQCFKLAGDGIALSGNQFWVYARMRGRIIIELFKYVLKLFSLGFGNGKL